MSGGPTTLFDKSFLQSLSLDESVWLDHFFVLNVCPIFFAETLADLEKPVREGRTVEDEVRVIAQKTPQMQGAPCVHHTQIALSNLMGRVVGMSTGQIPVGGARRVRVEGELGTVLEQTPEARAFSRWQSGEFHEVERDFARQWRADLQSLKLSESANLFRGLGVSGENCKSLESARDVARDTLSSGDHLADRMRLALTLLGIRPGLYRAIQERWSSLGRQPLNSYAPYAAYAAQVEVFFNLALAGSLISPERPSNRLDIAYLHYAPFCNVFVSSDNLHRRCAPLFLRDDQEFVWGPDLKRDLQAIDEHFRALPETIRALGIFAFAHSPPLGATLVVRLWDRFLPAWRNIGEEIKPSVENKKLVDRLRRFEKAPSLPDHDPAYEDPESVSFSIQRFVSKKRGSWYQVPKDLEHEKD